MTEVEANAITLKILQQAIAIEKSLTHPKYIVPRVWIFSHEIEETRQGTHHHAT